MSDDKQLVLERIINAPVARVWKALTAIEDLQQWLPFFPDFKAEVGFKTDFMLGPDAAHQYPHVVEVLEVVPGQKLTYTWDYGGQSNNSTVTFELRQRGEQTQLVLTCYIDPVPADEPDFMKNATAGWTHTADSLKQFAEANN